jgi:dethiobiotin synthetase/adenosylmethionine--8-amino-7-oxononanoate aminotransferase
LSSKHLHVVDSAYGDHYSIIEKRKEEEEEKEGEDGCSSRHLIDACASWWTQGLGHGRADVALAVGAAAGRYGHIIFPGNVHEPALRLAELMLAGPGKGWAERVFFSDNGSTAMEIAVKMALKKTSTTLSSSVHEEEKGGEGKVEVAVVTQRDCYHGDTLGCMDAAAPTVFNTGQHPWYQPRTLSLAVPTLGYVQGQLQVEVPREIVAASSLSSSSSSSSSVVGVRLLSFPGGMATLLDMPAREKSEVADMYRRAIRAHMDDFEAGEDRGGGQGRQPRQRQRRLGAVLLEPVLMGAAGMILVDPLFQRLLTLEGRRRGLPVVFDEVASGLHRLGCASAAELLGVAPDIACYGKTLTGGYLPLALTLTSEAVFQAFHGPAKSDALLHGHSYTANPLACAAAVRALEAYEAMHKDRDQQQQQQQQQQQHNTSSMSGGSNNRHCVHNERQVAALSQIAGVRRAVALGTVLAVELDGGKKGQGRGYGSTASADVVRDLKNAGVYARPLGNVVYLLASQVASDRTTQILIDALEQVLRHRATMVGSENGLEGDGGVVI